MGTGIHVFIEYDDCLEQRPFDVSYEVICYDDYYELYGGKDYCFFAAIAGIRNYSDKEPLFEMRGLPADVSDQVKEYMDDMFDPDEAKSWLYLSEIKLTLEHMGYSIEGLSLAVQVVLNTMEFLVSKIGDERVRLIFAFDS